MQTIHITSRGRLDQEKGRARLLPAIQSLCELETLPPFAIHIYGDGQYRQQIIELAAQHPEQIFYYGRQSLDTINQQLHATHYALMPSLFLETFGLTALESLSQGIPVIGYRKGGLKPFILNGLNIENYPGDKSQQIEHALHHIITTHTIEDRHTLHTQAQAIAAHYTPETYIKHITNLIGGRLPATILMISDYTNPLGGIETYLTKVQTLLQSHGSQVIIVGGSREKNANGIKYIQMLGTIRNPLLKYKIQKTIQTHQPDLVRYHSVLRNIGHAGIVGNPYGTARVTYHDLGLMHPFPSHVYDTKEIKPGITGRLSQSKWYQRPLVILKYLSTLLIRKKLAHHCQFHIVPSEFLTPMVTRAPTETIHTIPHYSGEDG